MTPSRWWVAAVLVASVVGLTVVGMRPRPEPPLEVQFATVKRESIVRTVTGAGKLQAATTVKISSNLSGDLVELHVRAGDRVHKGQLLGRIDRARVEAAAKQTQAARSAARADVQGAQVEVERTRAEVARTESLLEKGMASAAEVERARAERDSALARLSAAQERTAQASAAVEEAQTNVGKTTLVSPIEGTVIEVSREVGERVRGSDFSEDVVMTIASLTEMEVRIEVSEHEVVHLEQGEPAEVSVDALEGQVFSGSIQEIAQKALVKNAGTEAEVTTFPVIVALENRPPGTLPGMSAEVRIAAEKREGVLTVPVQAVTVRPEKGLPPQGVSSENASVEATPRVLKADAMTKVVFVLDGEQAQVRRVRTGLSSDTQVEIVEGLREGERVVEGPYRVLSKELQPGNRLKEAAARGRGRPRG